MEIKKKTIDYLAPAQKFLYYYGSFMAFWSNFEMMMEIAIFKENDLTEKENCKLINRLTAGQKKNKLTEILSSNGDNEKLEALNEVFDVADRNGWVHGLILNPYGNFTKLTRLRTRIVDGELEVTNNRIDFNDDPFSEFYPKWEIFMQVMGISIEEGDDYINKIQN